MTRRQFIPLLSGIPLVSHDGGIAFARCWEGARLGTGRTHLCGRVKCDPRPERMPRHPGGGARAARGGHTRSLLARLGPPRSRCVLMA